MERHCELLCGKQVVWRTTRKEGMGPDTRSAPSNCGVRNSDGQNTCRFPPILPDSAPGLQGACLKEAQLYLSGWKVHSRGRAAWDPQRQTSSSTQGRSSVPGPLGGLLRHPETRSSDVTVTPPRPSSPRLLQPQSCPRSWPVSTKSTRPRCLARPAHKEDNSLSGRGTFGVTKTLGSEDRC